MWKAHRFLSDPRFYVSAPIPAILFSPADVEMPHLCQLTDAMKRTPGVLPSNLTALYQHHDELYARHAIACHDGGWEQFQIMEYQTLNEKRIMDEKRKFWLQTSGDLTVSDELIDRFWEVYRNNAYSFYKYAIIGERPAHNDKQSAESEVNLYKLADAIVHKNVTKSLELLQNYLKGAQTMNLLNLFDIM